MLIFGGIILIIFGLLNIFAPDLIWSLTVFNNKWEGKASERTYLWDFGRRLGGIFLILLGLALFIFGIIEPGLTEKREEERKAHQEEFNRKLDQQTERLMKEYMAEKGQDSEKDSGQATD